MMPIKRGADGNIIEIPTKANKDTTNNDTYPTAPPNRGESDLSASGNNHYDAKTVVNRQAKHASSNSGNNHYDAQTEVNKGIKHENRGGGERERGNNKQTRVYRPGQSNQAHKSGLSADNNHYDAQTVVNEAEHENRGGERERGNNKQTRVYRPGQSTQPNKEVTGNEQFQHKEVTGSEQSQLMNDPPVGWLVVIAGPGQGAVVAMGNGANSIGRDSTERLSLDFGDEMISRSSHAIFTYDPKGKKFYIQQGRGTNLTYIDEQPVLSPQELPAHTNIVIGNTTLRFIPLCGDKFDWSSYE